MFTKSMYLSYKKYPEVKFLDPDKQYKALRYCLKKSRWFNVLFLAGLFFVALISQFAIENIMCLFNISLQGWLYYGVVLVSSFVAVILFIMYITNTYVHSKVVKHIDEFKDANIIYPYVFMSRINMLYRARFIENE